MGSLGVGRYAFSSCVAAALLAACGGSQPAIGASGALPQSPAIVAHPARGGSWMLPEAKNKDLLYVSAQSGISVYTYPGGDVVGHLNPGFFESFGECVDASGDVFVVSIPTESAEASTIYEYAHGGATPIATLSDPNLAISCAIDPTTGNLAAAGDGAAVFPHASGEPTVYPYQASFIYCGYDNVGNLYLSAENASSPYYALFIRLAPNSQSFQQINLSERAYSVASWPSVQWEGRYMTISSQHYPRTDPRSIYRLRISGDNAKVVSTTQLTSTKNEYEGQLWIQGHSILSVYHENAIWAVGVWPYPGGGAPRKMLLGIDKRNDPYAYGLVLSKAPSR